MFEQQSFVQHTVMAVYVAILLAVAFYGVHRYILVYLYMKYRNQIYQPKRNFDILPRVTVQLPMFNEDTVAERIIRATCQIDYPLDRLEIQVLDDSTDESADIARAACEQWAAKGYPIKYIHRTNRVGYKAGALADALPQASGEFIAIFDADFMSPAGHPSRTLSNYFFGLTRSAWSRSAGITSIAMHRC
jgi:cellulose synthase/poly-beta-1,6-N-acetylglucosamine synthase-like glycosyltransferase